MDSSINKYIIIFYIAIIFIIIFCKEKCFGNGETMKMEWVHIFKNNNNEMNGRMISITPSDEYFFANYIDDKNQKYRLAVFNDEGIVLHEYSWDWPPFSQFTVGKKKYAASCVDIGWIVGDCKKFDNQHVYKPVFNGLVFGDGIATVTGLDGDHFAVVITLGAESERYLVLVTDTGEPLWQVPLPKVGSIEKVMAEEKIIYLLINNDKGYFLYPFDIDGNKKKEIPIHDEQDFRIANGERSVFMDDGKVVILMKDSSFKDEVPVIKTFEIQTGEKNIFPLPLLKGINTYAIHAWDEKGFIVIAKNKILLLSKNFNPLSMYTNPPSSGYTIHDAYPTRKGEFIVSGDYDDMPPPAFIGKISPKDFFPVQE